MRTQDNKKILLSDQELENTSKLPLGIVGMPIFLIISILPLYTIIANHTPVQTRHLIIITIFGFLLYITFSLWIYFFFYRKKHPLTFQIIGSILHFRYFYTSSILYLTISSAHWYPITVVILSWILSEMLHHHDQKKVTDENIIKTFRKNFKSAENGNIYCTFNDQGIEKIIKEKRTRTLEIFEKFGMWGLGLICFLGPALFIRSQLYRDNVEPRFLILATISFFLAVSFRKTNTRQSYMIRALKLKKNGKF
ncbi:hypothetical protein [Thalassospira marina]|uniref:Uncharacterized protein n=1 Tax=Thalassospira marina TaxID=2048283 RepID=A0A2N3KTS0_9PROT|nr:hypothetical protein [Thalassospira marina]PKR53974.1 hypothetical protein COO20_10400 [Thalassospira marina]